MCVYVCTCDTWQQDILLKSLTSFQSNLSVYTAYSWWWKWSDPLCEWIPYTFLSIHSFISCECVWRPEDNLGLSCHLSILLFVRHGLSYWLTDQDAPGLYLYPPPWSCDYMCAPLCQTLFWKNYFLYFLRLCWNYIIFSFPFLPLNLSLYPSLFFVKLMEFFITFCYMCIWCICI